MAKVGHIVRYLGTLPTVVYAASDIQSDWQPGDERVVVESDAGSGEINLAAAERILTDHARHFEVVKPASGPASGPPRKAAPSAPATARKADKKSTTKRKRSSKKAAPKE